MELPLKLVFAVETAVMDKVLSTFLAGEGMLRFLDNFTVRSCSH